MSDQRFEDLLLRAGSHEGAYSHLVAMFVLFAWAGTIRIDGRAGAMSPLGRAILDSAAQHQADAFNRETV